MIKSELIDYMGSDNTVASSARVSFDKSAEFYTQGQNDSLIRYLARHNHFTPFTHCVITLRETVPIPVARQRFKSKVGFTENEISRRYVDDGLTFFFPEEWRQKADNKKQGSAGRHPKNDEIARRYARICELALEEYNWMIREGVAPEQARFIVPQGMMTSYYVTGSLAAFARAYKLRIAEDSQKEIQDLAKQWDEIIAPLYPESWKALIGESKDVERS